MIGIINYGLGNINAFYEIYKENGINLRIIDNYKDLNNNYNKIILPGVGSFDKAVTLLKSKLFFDKILNFSQDKNNKILGICVGMQILGSKSQEGNLSGFSYINNSFNKLKSKVIPHIGWNNVSIKKHYLFKVLMIILCFIFTFFVSLKLKTTYFAETNYEENFISVFEKENIIGVQFHPEKVTQGQKLLLNFYNN